METHLVNTYSIINEFQPDSVIIDPISNLISVGTREEVKSMLTRLLDYLKSQMITIMSTSLITMGQIETEIGISSLMDSWIDLKAVETDGERNRTIDIVKTRGMEHSNQLREFILTDDGIKLVDVYLGPSGMLTGSARVSQIAREKALKLAREQEIGAKQRQIIRKKEIMEAKIAELKAQFEAEKQELDKLIAQEELKEEVLIADRKEMRRIRQSNGDK